MKILLTNDDGIKAEGLKQLAFALSEHEVVVIAPDEERSAVSHSITIRTPLKYCKTTLFDNIESYAINGTPADCVKFGISHILKELPDLVISGINHGQNLGTDVIYSGTVSAAFEARFLGVKAIAVSCYGVHELDNKDLIKKGLEVSADFVKRNLNRLQEVSLPRNTILNINHPIKKASGTAVVPLGIQEYNDSYVSDATYADMYWLTGRPIKHEKNLELCDVELAYKNMITITPITYDFTNYNFLKELSNNFDA